MTRSVAGSMADAVVIRKGEPLLMQPSPTKSPASRRAITASLPCLFVMVIFTVPDWIKETESAGSPWLKMVCDLVNCAVVLATVGMLTGLPRGGSLDDRFLGIKRDRILTRLKTAQGNSWDGGGGRTCATREAFA